MRTQLDLFGEPTFTDDTRFNSGMNIKIKRLNENATIPQYAKEGDAGIDLVATDMTINESIARTTVVYGTGLAIEIPMGYVGLLFPRSSVYKTSLRLSNSVGVIDSGYRGEIMLNFTVIHNPLQPGTWKQSIYEVGDRVGQLMILPYPSINFVEVDELSDSIRGEGGFGSTGN